MNCFGMRGFLAGCLWQIRLHSRSRCSCSDSGHSGIQSVVAKAAHSPTSPVAVHRILTYMLHMRGLFTTSHNFKYGAAKEKCRTCAEKTQMQTILLAAPKKADRSKHVCIILLVLGMTDPRWFGASPLSVCSLLRFRLLMVAH